MTIWYNSFYSSLNMLTVKLIKINCSTTYTTEVKLILSSMGSLHFTVIILMVPFSHVFLLSYGDMTFLYMKISIYSKVLVIQPCGILMQPAKVKHNLLFIYGYFECSMHMFIYHAVTLSAATSSTAYHSPTRRCHYSHSEP
jgi:hypothetical protein